MQVAVSLEPFDRCNGFADGVGDRRETQRRATPLMRSRCRRHIGLRRSHTLPVRPISSRRTKRRDTSGSLATEYFCHLQRAFWQRFAQGRSELLQTGLRRRNSHSGLSSRTLHLNSRLEDALSLHPRMRSGVRRTSRNAGRVVLALAVDFYLGCIAHQSSPRSSKEESLWKSIRDVDFWARLRRLRRLWRVRRRSRRHSSLPLRQHRRQAP